MYNCATGGRVEGRDVILKMKKMFNCIMCLMFDKIFNKKNLGQKKKKNLNGLLWIKEN